VHQEAAEEFMLTSKFHISPQAALAVRTFVVAAWAIFGAAILFLNAPSPRGIYYIINTIGFVGLGVAIVWFVIAPKWRMACVALSILLIAVYLLRWYLQVDEIYETSPALGVSTAVERLSNVWVSVFEANRAKYGMLWALLAVYWDVFIVPVQVLVAALVFFYRHRSTKPLAQG
jgi:hypothetical protein